MVLINLNAIFHSKFTVKFENVRIVNASGLGSFVSSIKFQVRQIQATNHHFSYEKILRLCGSRFLKKNIFFGLRSHYHRQANIKKTCFATKNATKKILQNIEGYDHWYCPLVPFFVPFFLKKCPFWPISKYRTLL